MKGLFALLAAAAAMAALPQGAKAGPVTNSLADWCVNVNGDTKAACNAGAGSGISGTINLTGFDQTLSPASNTLGTVTITLGPGANQFVSFYAGYDVSYSSFGSFDDSASTSGALPAGWSFSVNNPNVTDIASLTTGFVLFDQWLRREESTLNIAMSATTPLLRSGLGSELGKAHHIPRLAR